MIWGLLGQGIWDLDLGLTIVKLLLPVNWARIGMEIYLLELFTVVQISVFKD